MFFYHISVLFPIPFSFEQLYVSKITLYNNEYDYSALLLLVKCFMNNFEWHVTNQPHQPLHFPGSPRNIGKSGHVKIFK